jgi:hypothetical protein
MSSRVTGNNLPSNQDPRRENRIYRYTPVTNKPNQDPLPDYVSLLGMIFSMLGLMMRVSLNELFYYTNVITLLVDCFPCSILLDRLHCQK